MNMSFFFLVNSKFFLILVTLIGGKLFLIVILTTRDPSTWKTTCSYLRSYTLIQVSAILLDPSCSGSGTASQRLDHLLPSHTTDVVDTERLNKLAAFQKKALAHALSCMFSF